MRLFLLLQGNKIVIFVKEWYKSQLFKASLLSLRTRIKSKKQ